MRILSVSRLAGALSLTACAASTTVPGPSPSTVAPSDDAAIVVDAAADPASGAAPMCPDDLLRDGGALFETADGTQLWYELAGPVGAPTIVILHGGPGSNARTFKHALATHLERQFAVLYLDQRGCGRSRQLGPGAPLGMVPTVQDIDALRRHLGIDRLHAIGHSFGGLVALELLRAHPDTTGAVILVDTTDDIEAALLHQVATVAANAPTLWPEHADALAEIAKAERSAFEKIGLAYGELGRTALQRQLHFASDDAQARFEALDAATATCTLRAVAPAFAAEGWFAPPTKNRSAPPPGSVVVFAGRRSEVIGHANVRAAANRWAAPVVWFEHSGHFIYWEEPERFADEVRRVVDPVD